MKANVTRHSTVSPDSFDRIEAEFKAALDESLDPRGQDSLYDYVTELNLGPGSIGLDVGCGDGKHAIELVKRFGLDVLGVDPVPRHVEAASKSAREQTAEHPEMPERAHFRLGRAEQLPADDAAFDLVWCRDVLTLVEDLDAAYHEIHRVLKPGGRALIYQMFTTDKLEPREAASMLTALGSFAANMRPDFTESTIMLAGLSIDRCDVLGSEWGEYAEEHTGKSARNLIHVARLLRQPEPYIQRFGKENYDVAVADCLWHIYRLIGKLSGRVYLLSKS
jgi:SAM-dependent methyltransferase